MSLVNLYATVSRGEFVLSTHCHLTLSCIYISHSIGGSLAILLMILLTNDRGGELYQTELILELINYFANFAVVVLFALNISPYQQVLW